MTNAEIKQMIRDGIDKVRELGGKVVDGRFNLDYRGGVYHLVEGDENCCALSALMVGRKRERALTEDIIRTVGRDRSWLWSFISGFDGTPESKLHEWHDTVLNMEAYEMGRALREEVL